MKTRVTRMLMLALLLLTSMMIYADGSPIPWCPISCSLNVVVR